MRAAIQFTLLTIEGRARLHRNVVVAVSLVMLATPVVSLYLRSWRTLWLIVLLVPIVLIYLAMDAVLVRRWRLMVIAACESERVSLLDFRQTVTSLKHLPEATVRGMIATLPLARGGT
jgi:hypothetical protein